MITLTMDASRRAIARELHRPARRNFPRRRVRVKGLNDLYQADIVEMIPHAKFNRGMRYILTVINCFSKFAYAIPLKSKTGEAVAAALKPIFEINKMKYLQTDQGKEFYNSHVRHLLSKHNINLYSTYSDLKSSIVERFNRTLKEKMYEQFTARGKYEWLSILQELVDRYNNSKHRSIGMKPKDVRKKHVKIILNRLNPPFRGPVPKPKFNLDDSVRISKHKRVFTKGYLPNWSTEIFKVFAIKPTIPVTYILQDLRGEIVKGGFYEHELNLSKTGDNYLIEKVLRRKGKRALVRWLGHDKAFDSWIDL